MSTSITNTLEIFRGSSWSKFELKDRQVQGETVLNIYEILEHNISLSLHDPTEHMHCLVNTSTNRVRLVESWDNSKDERDFACRGDDTFSLKSGVLFKGPKETGGTKEFGSSLQKYGGSFHM